MKFPPSTAADTARICSNPVHHMMIPEEFEAFNHKALLATALRPGFVWKGITYPQGFRFLQHQGNAIKEFRDIYDRGDKGGFFPLGVGRGKTNACLSMANYAYTHHTAPSRRILYVLPPHLCHQLTGRDIRDARSIIPFNMPVHVLHGKSEAARALIADRKAPGLYIFPYSLLSTKDTNSLLEAIEPEGIICDEAHLLANMHSARTKRLFRYIESRQPWGVALSGTITSKAVKDYQHLTTWTLRNNSPLPLSRPLAEEWGLTIDAEAVVGMRPHGGLETLRQWAQGNFPDELFETDPTTADYRKAYRLRLSHSKGVVSSGADSLGTSLTLCNRPVANHEKHNDWLKLKELLDGVTQRWVTPNGDEIDHAIHTWKWIYELSAGFYNQLLWPEPSSRHSQEEIDAAIAHHELGQVYHSALRGYLQRSRNPDTDTPFKVGSHFQMHKGAGNLPYPLYEAWAEWKSAAFEGMPVRYSKPVRVCDYKIAAACMWAFELPAGEGGIIWCHNLELAAWVHESLSSCGLKSIALPSDEQIENPNAGKDGTIMVLSIKRYCEGKNLQHFQHQAVLQWPRQARTAEQMLGRTHRTGQKSDELFVYSFDTLDEDHLNRAASISDSLYIHQSLGVAQKQIFCNYDPEPLIFPGEVLRERGLLAP